MFRPVGVERDGERPTMRLTDELERNLPGDEAKGAA